MTYRNMTRFKEILDESIERIAYIENKHKLEIEEELAVLVNRRLSTIQSWQKPNSHMPGGDLVKILAKEIYVRKGFPPDSSIEEFLGTAGFPDAELLGDQLIGELVLPENNAKPINSKDSDGNNQDQLHRKFFQVLWKKKIVVPFIVFIIIVFLIIEFISLSLAGVQLVSWYGDPVVVSVNGNQITNNTNIHIGDKVSVTFTIINTSPHLIVIKTLAIGTNGPGFSCNDSLQKRWGTVGRYSFRPVNYIFLLPQQQYRFSSSRTFDETGSYFVEPVIQSFDRGWGGILPFTCVDFVVNK